jgi:hypothetical protein
MTGEYYTYNVSTTTGSYNRKQEYSSQKNYWLSLGSLSIGVEKKLSDNLSISAAPFVKIPFRGVGQGELKLTGTGINFMLSYKPFFSKK